MFTNIITSTLIIDCKLLYLLKIFKTKKTTKGIVINDIEWR